MEVNYKKRLQNCYVGIDCISEGESREASKGTCRPGGRVHNVEKATSSQDGGWELRQGHGG